MSYDAMCQVINTGETHKTYEAIKRNVSWHFQHLFMNFHVHIQNMVNLFCTNTPGDVNLLELVETSQHTSTSNTSQDVGSSTLHQGHEALRLDNLHTAIDGALVLDSLARGHHHAT